MSNNLDLTAVFDVEGQKVKLSPNIIKEYLLGDKNATVTNQEFKLFVELCKARQLNPFLKEVYFIKYGNESATMVVGKDALLKRAIKHPKYNGSEDGIIVLNPKNEVIERQGCFKLPEEKVVGGWARVFRKDWDKPIYASVGFEEVAQKKRDGNYNTFWHNKPATMINKVAISRALRKAFTEDLAGMYEAEEMDISIPSSVVSVESKVDAGEITEISEEGF